MKKFVLFICSLILFVSSNPCFAASSLTQSKHQQGTMTVIVLEWTAHTDGTFTATDTTWNIDGFIIKAETEPAPYTTGEYVSGLWTETATTGTAPTDDYDITLNDLHGLDVFGGSLADRDTANAEVAMPLINGSYQGVANRGPLTLGITGNTGNTAKGVIKIFYYGQ